MINFLAEQSVQAKKSRVEDESTMQSPHPNLLRVVISDALANFFGTGEREMLQSEALGRLWEYIKVNQLEVSGYDCMTWKLSCLLCVFEVPSFVS